MKYITTLDDQTFEIEINADDQITVNGERLSIDFRSVSGQPVYSLIVNGQSHEAYVQVTEAGLEVLLQGQLHVVEVEDERQRKLRESSGGPVVHGGEFNLQVPDAGTDRRRAGGRGPGGHQGAGPGDPRIDEDAE